MEFFLYVMYYPTAFNKNLEKESAKCFVFGFKREVPRPSLCMAGVWKDAVAKLIVLCYKETDLYIVAINTTLSKKKTIIKLIC